MNYENLKIAIEALDNVKPEEFNMRHFRAFKDENGSICNLEGATAENCGSIGCWLGWLPFRVDTVKYPQFDLQGSDLDKKLDYETGTFTGEFEINFNAYRKRLFGLVDQAMTWDWLFHGAWTYVDAMDMNTIEGAKRRGLALLKYPDLVKSVWESEMYTDALSIMATEVFNEIEKLEALEVEKDFEDFVSLKGGLDEK